jgi:hypothetical protein
MAMLMQSNIGNWKMELNKRRYKDIRIIYNVMTKIYDEIKILGSEVNNVKNFDYTVQNLLYKNDIIGSATGDFTSIVTKDFNDAYIILKEKYNSLWLETIWEWFKFNWNLFALFKQSY